MHGKKAKKEFFCSIYDQVRFTIRATNRYEIVQNRHNPDNIIQPDYCSSKYPKLN